MEEIIQRILDEQLRDFRGTEIEGQLVVADELVNAGLSSIIRKPTATEPSDSAAVGTDNPLSSVSLPQLLSWLTIDKLQYRTEEGRSVVELAVRVE